MSKEISQGNFVRTRLHASISCLYANTVSCFSCSRRCTGSFSVVSQRLTVRSLRSRYAAICFHDSSVFCGVFRTTGLLLVELYTTAGRAANIIIRTPSYICLWEPHPQLLEGAGLDQAFTHITTTTTIVLECGTPVPLLRLPPHGHLPAQPLRRFQNINHANETPSG